MLTIEIIGGPATGVFEACVADREAEDARRLHATGETEADALVALADLLDDLASAVALRLARLAREGGE